MRAAVLIIIVGASFAVPGWFSVPPIDRDESRFAEASRTMLFAESWRDYIVPMIQGEPRLNKPPLVYWAHVGLIRAFGWEQPLAAPMIPRADAGGALQHSVHLPGVSADGGIWKFRFLSILCAIIAALLTWRIGCAMSTAPIGLLAAILLLGSVLVVLDMQQARADQLLLALTTLAYLALYQIWTRRLRSPGYTRGWAVLLWTAVALGMLTKGPITPALVLLSAGVLAWLARDTRWFWRHVRPVTGLLLASLPVLAWTGGVIVLVGWQPVWIRFVDEIVARSALPREGHLGLPGYHALLSPVTLWPSSLALIPAIFLGVRRGLKRPRSRRGVEPTRPEAGRIKRWWRGLRELRARKPSEAFLLAWLIPGWIVFELLATKLPHYVLPLAPAFCLLAARALIAAPHYWRWVFETRTGRTALGGWVVLSLVLGAVAPAAFIAILRPHFEPGANLLVWAMIAAQLALGAMLARTLAQRRVLPAQALALALGMNLAVILLQLALPRLPNIWLSNQVVVAAYDVDPTGARPLADAGYHEASLVFLTRDRANQIEPNQIADWIDANPDGMVIIPRAPGFQSLGLSALVQVEGFNYSRGDHETLVISERTPKAP